MRGPHEILEVKPGASQAQIKNSYRRLAKKYHPDVSKEVDAEERFIAITEAYDKLLSGSTEFKDLRDHLYQESHESPENARRKRAREYAHMKYGQFVRNNTAFKRTWYYRPVKYAIYFAIYLGYAIGALFLVGALVFWITHGFSLQYIYTLFISLFGVYIIKSSSNFKKEVKPYFDNYE